MVSFSSRSPHAKSAWHGSANHHTSSHSSPIPAASRIPATASVYADEYTCHRPAQCLGTQIRVSAPTRLANDCVQTSLWPSRSCSHIQTLHTSSSCLPCTGPGCRRSSTLLSRSRPSRCWQCPTDHSWAVSSHSLVLSGPSTRTSPWKRRFMIRNTCALNPSSGRRTSSWRSV